jgi:glycosyltransferase involved in cell wall biosynthesis
VVARERPDVVHGHDWLARSFLPLRRRAGPALVMSLHYYTLTCPKKTLLFRDGELCTGPAPAKCLGCAGEHYGRAKGAGIVLANLAGAAAERRAVDLFLPVSQATADGNAVEERGLPYEVLPNFVSEPPSLGAAERELLTQLPEDGFLLYVGDLRAEKGIHVLLEAYRGLEGAPPLVLIGKRWPKSPTELPPGVRFLEHWPNAAVREAQRRCRALVVPSVWAEPFGAVVIEALVEGRPVVASGAGGIVDLVQDGENGLLADRGDPGSLRAALQRVVDDDALVESLASRAAETGARFREDAVLPRLERAYGRALATPPGGIFKST